MPSPLPAAPLVVCRRYLIVVFWPLRRCAPRVLGRGAQADARGVTQVLDRSGQAVACGSCLSQVLNRGAEAAARGAARCASHVLDRGAQAGAQVVACGDAALSQQEKNTRQMSREPEQILPTSSAQRQGNPWA